jgi:hypothetical protein
MQLLFQLYSIGSLEVNLTQYSLPKNDSLPFLFTLKNPNGTAVTLNPGFAITLAIKNSTGTSVYTATATFDTTTIARVSIVPNAMPTPGLYEGAIRAVSSTEAHTYSFQLVITDHA